MANDDHVIFTLSAFAFIERMNRRILESSNIGRKPDGPAQVGRATLGHLHTGAGEVAGLLHRRVNTCIGGELCRRGEPPDVTADFREDDGGKGGSNAGDRRELGVKTGQKPGNLGVEDSDRIFKGADLFDVLADDEREAAGSHHDAEGISGGILDFLSLRRTEPAAARLFQQLRKLLRSDGEHFFWRGVLGQYFHGGGSEGVRKELLVLGKDLIQQRDDLALQIGGHVDDVEALAAQLTHGLKVAGFHGSLTIPAKADDIGDDDAVDGIGLGLADVHAAQRIGLDGVDDMHRKAVIAQMRVERQPVVAGRLHAEHDGLVETSHHVHEFVVTRLGIGKAHGLADDASILGDDRRFVILLGNVNTDEQHRKHLEKSSCGQSSERSGSKSTWTCEDSR